MFWKDVEGNIQVQFKLLFWHLRGGVEGNHKNLTEDKLVPEKIFELDLMHTMRNVNHTS
jgi:hypothetical protein